MAHRIYTPPTCTLSVETTHPFLPTLPWGSQAVKELEQISPVSRISFVLSFDDPRQATESITVRGDRSQLDRLSLAVNRYIQEFLSEKEPLDSISLTSNATGGRSSQLAGTQTLTPQKLRPQNPGSNSTSPYLQPQGFLSHRLYLGELQASNLTSNLISNLTSIELTTTQLFDLATALDDYTNEINTVAPRNNWWKSKWFANWGLATAAMLCSVGLISLGLKLLQNHNAAESIAPNSQTLDNRPAPADVQIFPIPGASIPPLPTASPLGATQKLTIPNPVQAPPGSSVNIPPLAPPAIPQTAGNNQGNQNNQGNLGNQNNQTSVFPTGEAPDSTLPNLGNSPRSGEPNFLPNSGQVSGQTSGQPSPLSLAPPNLPNLPALNPDEFQQTPAPATPPLSLENNLEGNVAPNPVDKENSPESGALFDQIPQVPEVRKYFQSRWQPSGDSSPTLEYSLVLNSNGSIAQIIPLGQGAQNYLDRLEFPALNTPFVTPFPNGGRAKIRLVLSVDGRVQTFLESP